MGNPRKWWSLLWPCFETTRNMPTIEEKAGSEDSFLLQLTIARPADIQKEGHPRAANPSCKCTTEGATCARKHFFHDLLVLPFSPSLAQAQALAQHVRIQVVVRSGVQLLPGPRLFLTNPKGKRLLSL